MIFNGIDAVIKGFVSGLRAIVELPAYITRVVGFTQSFVTTANQINVFGALFGSLIALIIAIIVIDIIRDIF